MNRKAFDILQQVAIVMEYLYEHAAATPEELCEAASCTMRTLLRVIAKLRERCGADVRWDIKRQRYAMINRHDFVPPELELSEEKVIQNIYDTFLHHPQPGSTTDLRRRDERTLLSSAWSAAEEEPEL